VSFKEARMYDVYLNGKNDLLVVPRGSPIPLSFSGNWRKKKRVVRSVSEKIREDVRGVAIIAATWLINVRMITYDSEDPPSERLGHSGHGRVFSSEFIWTAGRKNRSAPGGPDDPLVLVPQCDGLS
jgi:hypothetical protein